jgi:hypothetical protein
MSGRRAAEIRSRARIDLDDTRNLTESERLDPATRQRPPNETLRDKVEEQTRVKPVRREEPEENGELEPLFAEDQAASFRSRWSALQGSFVDDPRRAVNQGDQLVSEVMQNLTRSFANEHQRLEAELTGTGEPSTEVLRVALRRYRSFFERLLEL